MLVCLLCCLARVFAGGGELLIAATEVSGRDKTVRDAVVVVVLVAAEKVVYASQERLTMQKSALWC